MKYEFTQNYDCYSSRWKLLYAFLQVKRVYRWETSTESASNIKNEYASKNLYLTLHSIK